MFCFQHIVCCKNNLSTAESQSQKEGGLVDFLPVFSLLFESFFIHLLLTDCRHISTNTTSNDFILSRRDFFLFVHDRNEELFLSKLILPFGYVPDEKKIFFREKKPWSFSFSDTRSPVHVEDEQRFSIWNQRNSRVSFSWQASVKWTCFKCFPFIRLKRYNEYLISLVFSVRTV